ncbi:hypothetical protein GCM10020331_099870 [Ectobacillus funiculus]
MQKKLLKQQYMLQTEIHSKKHVFQYLVVLMRILFGVGWLLAGVTKMLGKGGSTGHSWFAQPGVFLNDYLIKVLDKPNVPDFFYKFFY